MTKIERNIYLDRNTFNDLHASNDIQFVVSTTNYLIENNIKRFNSDSGEVLEYGESYENLADYLPVLFLAGEQELALKEVDRDVAHLSFRKYLYRKKARVCIIYN